MKRIISLCLSALVLAVSCASDEQKHFISDAGYRAQVEKDFAARESICSAAGVDLESMGLTSDEKEALQFLYAYMPLGISSTMILSFIFSITN